MPAALFRGDPLEWETPPREEEHERDKRRQASLRAEQGLSGQVGDIVDAVLAG